MKRLAVLIVALGVLSGCEAMNDAAVRSWHMDHQLGMKTNEQIKEGYRRRMEVPPPASNTPNPAPTAPTGLDEG